VDADLEAWLRGALPRAVAYARTLLPRPQDAEDIVHDVLCRLLDHPEYDLPEDGDKLLFRSITNACINASRRRHLLRLHFPDGQESRASAAARDPGHVAAERDLLWKVRDELRRLPLKQRAAVELKATGRTLDEIAAVLDVSATYAGVLVHRGRKKLRRRLGGVIPRELRE
jgi:RNA polymerase sigma-70 factor (ECF subfamily)